MRTFTLAAALALAACSPTSHPNCHKSTEPDDVGSDGELHYPEVCTTSTTPARTVTSTPVATDPVSQALAQLRPDAPDPCREYTREHCAQGTDCVETVREVNKIASHKRAYSQCVAMLKRDTPR
jgi:hypothetical protein